MSAYESLSAVHRFEGWTQERVDVSADPDALVIVYRHPVLSHTRYLYVGWTHMAGLDCHELKPGDRVLVGIDDAKYKAMGVLPLPVPMVRLSVVRDPEPAA